MGTLVALFRVRAKRSGSARADVSECSALLGVERMPPLPEEFLFVLAKDIGDFQSMFDHLCRPSPLKGKIFLSWSASNGLVAVWIRVVETRRYRAVV